MPALLGAKIESGSGDSRRHATMSFAERWVLPGALLAVVLWLTVAALFSGYLSVFGAFTSMYGSLSGVVVVMLFFYVSGAIFIFGAEFNAAVAEIEDRSLRRD